MQNDFTSKIALTSQGDIVYDRTDPKNPVFQCYLSEDTLGRLRGGPDALRKMARCPKDFWLKVLVGGIRAGGQFVFETLPAPPASDAQGEVAARTLFQLNGDILLKIDENVLQRTDGLEVIEGHFSWTNWCVEQLAQALFPGWLSWLPLIFGMLSLTFGAISHEPKVMVLGVGVSLLLLVGLLVARRMRWGFFLRVPMLGAPFLVSEILLVIKVVWSGEAVSWTDILSWIWAIGPAVGLVPVRLILNVISPVMAWYIRRKVRQVL